MNRKRNQDKAKTGAVDLGTGESQCAVHSASGEPSVISLDGTQTSLFSDIFICEDGKVLTGKVARNAAAMDPDRHCADWKRFIGRNTVLLSCNGKDYTAEDLARFHIERIHKALAERFPDSVFKFVITCPVYFDDHQRKRLKRIFEEAGTEVIGIKDEPVAGAMYSVEQMPMGSVCIVIDDGCGTFDVTIIRIVGDGKAEVLGKSGDMNLAGQDLDRAITEEAVRRVVGETKQSLDFTDPAIRKEIAGLCARAQEAKHELSELPVSQLFYNIQGKSYSWPISRDEFEGLIAPFLEQQKTLMQKALDDAGLKAEDIDLLVAIGGTSRVPAVRKCAEELLGKEAVCEGNPQEAVVLGAAMLARQMIHNAEIQDQELIEMAYNLPACEVQDICGYPLSVAVVRSRIDHTLVACEMITKGAPLPAEHQRDFSPQVDMQTSIRATLVALSDGTPIDQAKSVGHIEMDIPPRSGRENQDRILARVRVDHSSLIHFHVKDRVSGEEREIEVRYEK